jgi:hypothetical protein
MAAAQERAFTGYPFTGELRPGLVSPMQTVPDHIQKPDYAIDGNVFVLNHALFFFRLQFLLFL